MARIQRGRHTHDHTRHSEGLCVFLIGMRVNRWWRPDAWLPTFAAMGPMIAELSADPDSGFLGARYAISPQGPLLVQYWRSSDDVYRYAVDRDARHRPAWTAFNQRAKRVPGAVGVWHETFEVSAAETLAIDMPASDLAAAVGSVPASPGMRSAAQRLRAGAARAQAPSAPARKAADRSS